MDAVAVVEEEEEQEEKCEEYWEEHCCDERAGERERGIAKEEGHEAAWGRIRSGVCE